MYPYALLVSIILVLQVRIRRKGRRELALLLSFLVLFLFAAMRGNGRGDCFNYLKFASYVTTPEVLWNPSFPTELGFRIIAYIVNQAGLHLQAVIAAMNLISLSCTYRFVREYSPDGLLSTILFLPFFLQFDMHAARTAVAIGISTLGYKHVLERSYGKYALVILCASLFHRSALVLLPIVFFLNVKHRSLPGLMSIGVALALSMAVSFSALVFRMVRAVGLVSFANKFYAYTQSDLYGYPFRLYDPRLLLTLGIYLMCLAFLDQDDAEDRVLTNYMWLSVVLMIALREHTLFITRLTAFLSFYSIIAVPRILLRLGMKGQISTKRIMKLGFVYTYLVYVTGLLAGAVEYRLFL